RGLQCPSHNSDDLDIAQTAQSFRMDASHKPGSENCSPNLSHFSSPPRFQCFTFLLKKQKVLIRTARDSSLRCRKPVSFAFAHSKIGSMPVSSQKSARAG